MNTRTDQPSTVTTAETPRAPDEHVVTSDVPEDAKAPREADPPAPAAAPDDGSPPSPDSAPGETQPGKPSRNHAAERRIRKLTSKLEAAEARDRTNSQRIEELEDTVHELKTPKAKEPQLQDFKNPREYAQAYSKWEKDKAKPPRRREKPAPTAAAAPPADPPAGSATPPVEIPKEILDFQAKGKEKLGDEFLEAIREEGVAVSQTMGEFMMDNDIGPELYVHLANNPKDARSIYDLPAHKAVKEMEKLVKLGVKKLDVGEEGELRVEPLPGDPPEDPAPPPARTTKAPDPPGSTREPGDVAPASNPETEDMDTYAARRRKEEARKAGLPV